MRARVPQAYRYHRMVTADAIPVQCRLAYMNCQPKITYITKIHPFLMKLRGFQMLIREMAMTKSKSWVQDTLKYQPKTTCIAKIHSFLINLRGFWKSMRHITMAKSKSRDQDTLKNQTKTTCIAKIHSFLINLRGFRKSMRHITMAKSKLLRDQDKLNLASMSMRGDYQSNHPRSKVKIIGFGTTNMILLAHQGQANLFSAPISLSKSRHCSNPCSITYL